MDSLSGITGKTPNQIILIKVIDIALGDWINLALRLVKFNKLTVARLFNQLKNHLYIQLDYFLPMTYIYLF